MFEFTKAKKYGSKFRVAFIGPSGSGKTYTSLKTATHVGKTAVIDTERGSARKYANLFDFDVLELASFSPQTYIDAIKAAETAGYEVIVIDSLSHAWSGTDGAIEQVEKAQLRANNRSSFFAWRDVTPLHNQMVNAIINSTCHIIVTMRVKTEYVIEENERGQKVPRKIGLQPVQRQGFEYEFDIVCDLNQDNYLMVDKTRCPELKGYIRQNAGEEFADILMAWTTDGEAEPPKPVDNGTWNSFKTYLSTNVTNLDEAIILATAMVNAQYGVLDPAQVSDTGFRKYLFDNVLPELKNNNLLREGK